MGYVSENMRSGLSAPARPHLKTNRVSTTVGSTVADALVAEGQAVDGHHVERTEKSMQLWADALLAKQLREGVDEFVAEELIALELSDGYWIPLKNDAELSRRGSSFLTNGLEVHMALLARKDYYLALVVEAESRSAHAAEVARNVLKGLHITSLWHSHYVGDGPSQVDIENFPEDMVKVGKVYHAPTGRTTLYNSTGVLLTP